MLKLFHSYDDGKNLIINCQVSSSVKNAICIPLKQSHAFLLLKMHSPYQDFHVVLDKVLFVLEWYFLLFFSQTTNSFLRR